MGVALLPRTRMVTKLLVCLLVLLPGIFAGTKFEKCKRLGTDLCFKMKVKEIVVKIGNVGTNDDVTINLCSDYETDKCCTTPVLSSLLSDDWSKTGKSQLLVDHITVIGQSPDKKNPELEQFKCNSYDIGKNKLPKETKVCTTHPYHYQQIEKAIFQIGRDGTDNDVIFKIGSDSNNVTCSQKLSHTLSDDWRKNKLETWLRSDFGKCKDMLYKITTAPIFSISKTGKDDLIVRSASFNMKRVDNGQVIKYECGPFEFKGDCKDASFCTKTFNTCKFKTVVNTGTARFGSTTTKTTTKITTTTKKPGLISRLFGSGKNKTTTTTTTASTTTVGDSTTTKKGLLGKLFG